MSKLAMQAVYTEPHIQVNVLFALSAVGMLPLMALLRRFSRS